MNEFSRWIASSELNNALEASAWWIIPTLQVIHILSIAVVISSAIMVHGRMVRAIVLNQTIPEATQRFLPWMWAALLLLLVSGCVLILMEPLRTLGKEIFWLKMAAVSLGVFMTAWLHRDVTTRPDHWRRDKFGPAITLFAVVNVSVWVFIVFAGRWIAYA